MAVDLLVCTYNTLYYVQKLFNTLHSDYEPDVWRLHIQDNGSTDGTKEWLLENHKKYKVSNLIISNNVGYSAAINGMASITNADFLAAVNGDTWFTTNHVKDVLDSFKNDSPGVIGVKMLDETYRIRHAGIYWDRVNNPEHRGFGQFDPMDTAYKTRRKAWTVSGAIYYMRRDMWNELADCPEYRKLFPDATGAFLPTPHFFEETWVSQHAVAHGYDVIYDGTIETAGHAWHASNADSDWGYKMFQISRGIYITACESHGIEHECRD